MEIIYIGEEFYHKSGTRMSSLYDTDGNRQDWEFVTIALQKGESVHIRPATEEEKLPYIKQLEALLDLAAKAKREINEN